MSKSNYTLPPNFYSGTSGLVLPLPSYQFPEEHQGSSRLTYYSIFLNSIEINSSFYKLPMKRTVEKWMLLVPADFKFTFKLWKEVTHIKGLDFKEEDVQRFFDIISGAGEKKGSVLVQFPPSFGRSHTAQLYALLKSIDEANDHQWQIAVEFRNMSWYHEGIYELLDAYNMAMVIHDMPGSATPMITQASGHVYIRFHGPSGNYRDSYSESFLSEYASYIAEWLDEGKVVYVYFNNTAGEAFQNPQTLNRLVSQ